MFTVLWDNDGVLVETEGLYYESSRQVLATVGIDLSVEVFQEVSLRQGRSTLELAAARGVDEQEIERLKQERDRLFAEAQSSLAADPRCEAGPRVTARSRAAGSRHEFEASALRNRARLDRPVAHARLRPDAGRFPRGEAAS